MIEVRCFDSLHEIASLRAEINAVNLASPRPDPFSTFEFLENFFQHDESAIPGERVRLWFLVAMRDGCLVGYLALKHVSRRVVGIPMSKLGFFVTHDTDRPHLVARTGLQDQVSAAFYAYLLGRKREWSFLEFQQQDGSSALFPPPGTVNLKGYLVRQWPSMENGTIRVRWGSLREYYTALSKKSRSNVSRQMRSLLAAGDVEWVASSDPAITPALLEIYRGIEPRSWKSRANAIIGRHPKRVEYVKGLLGAQQPMRISIQILLLDGLPIAGLISGAFMKGLHALHIVYDDRLSRLAPGSAMLLMGMREAIVGRYEFFNLLSGFGYYKSRWLADITETRTAQIYRVGGPMFWRRVLGDWKRRVSWTKEKIEPALFNPARREVSAYEGEPTNLVQDMKLNLSAEDQRRSDVLMAKIRQGDVEIFTKDALVALMPFEPQRVAEIALRKEASLS